MKHIQGGAAVGLGMEASRLTFINLNVLNENTNKSKVVRFMVDTGFNGYLQLNKKDLEELGLKIVQKTATQLADGRKVEVGVTKTKIKILDQEISDFPIHVIENGINLLGTALLNVTKKMIVFDYEDGYVTITENSVLKTQIKKEIDNANK